MRLRVIVASCIVLTSSSVWGEENLLGQQDFADSTLVSTNGEWLAAQSGEPAPFADIATTPTTLTWTHFGLSTFGQGTLTFSLWDVDSDDAGIQVSELLFDGVPQDVTIFETDPGGSLLTKVYQFVVDADLITDGSLEVSLVLPTNDGNEFGIDFSRLVVEPGCSNTSTLGEQDFADNVLVSTNGEWLASQSGEPAPFDAVATSPVTLTWTHVELSTLGPGILTFSLWDLDSDDVGVQVSELLFDGVSQDVSVFETNPGGSLHTKVYQFAIDASLLSDGELEVSLVLPNDDGNEVGIDFSRVIVDSACVPTVSEWGVAVMMLLLLTAGTIVYTKRHPVAA